MIFALASGNHPLSSIYFIQRHKAKKLLTHTALPIIDAVCSLAKETKKIAKNKTLNKVKNFTSGTVPGSSAGGGGPGPDGSDPEAGLPGRRTGGMAFGGRLSGPLLRFLLGQHPFQGTLHLHLQSKGSDLTHK